MQDLINDVGMLLGQSFKMFETSDLTDNDVCNLYLQPRACVSLDQVHGLLKEGILSSEEASGIIRTMLMLPKQPRLEGRTPDEQPSPKRVKQPNPTKDEDDVKEAKDKKPAKATKNAKAAKDGKDASV